MPTLYLASHNRHKAQEIQDILGSSWTVRSCKDIAPDLTWDENGKTFEANALIKAESLRGDEPRFILADDSGLEVEALGGAPGIYSARYAGEGATDLQNLEKLVNVMREIPEGKRRARFVCVICCLGVSEGPQYFRGECNGTLLKEAVGSGGFGYDPIFVPDGHKLTFAELGDAVKNQISHRALALEQLKAFLKKSRLG